MAEHAFKRESFLLLAPSDMEASGLHQRFLDQRSPLPLHRSWAELLVHAECAAPERVETEVVAIQVDSDNRPATAREPQQSLFSWAEFMAEESATPGGMAGGKSPCCPSLSGR